MKIKFYTKRSLLFVALAFLTATATNAQTWSFYNTHNSSIPDSAITCIAMESNGTKWMGSSKGLIKFDGVNWTLYDTSNSGLKSNAVQQVVIDSANNKWISYNRGNIYYVNFCGFGLTKFDGTSWTTYDKNNSGLLTDTVSLIAVRANSTDIYISYGSAWQGPQGNGIINSPVQTITKFDGSNWTHNKDTNITFMWPTDLEVSNNGTIWVAHKNGFSKYKAGVWTDFTGGHPGSGAYFSLSISVVIDATGDTAIGTNWINEVIKISDTTCSKIKTGSSFDGNILAFDNSHNLWVLGSFLYKIVGDTAIQYGNGYTGTRTQCGFLFDGNTFYASTGYVNPPAPGAGYGLSMINISPTAFVLENKIYTSELFSLFPNPFKNTTQIKYHLDDQSVVTLTVYNLLGECVLQLENNNKKLAGDYTQFIELNQSGIYFVKLNINGKEFSQRIVNTN